MKTFDKTVPFYDRFMHRFNLYQTQTLLSWLNLKGTEILLDLGGGTGHTSHKLSAYCREITLLDESPAMLQQAEKHGSFKCIQGNALKTPFTDESFDIVLVTDLFHHIPEQELLVKEIKRILKPNGRLMLQDFVKGHPGTLLLRIFEFFLFGLVYFKSPGQIRKIISSQDFELIQEEQRKTFLFQLWSKS